MGKWDLQFRFSLINFVDSQLTIMRILKLFTIITLAIAVMPHTAYGLSAAGVFTSAPSEIFPLLDRNARLDMYDYFTGGFENSTANSLKGESRITAMSPMAMSIDMTPASTCEISLLPTAGGDTIVALITTVRTPVPDSHINFYDRKWTELSVKKYISLPNLNDWLTNTGNKAFATVAETIPFLLTSFTYNPDTKCLTLTDHTGEFLSEDDYEIVKPYLREKITYVWNGKKFNRE